MFLIVMTIMVIIKCIKKTFECLKIRFHLKRFCAMLKVVNFFIIFEHVCENNLLFKLKGAEKVRIKKSREGNEDPSFHRTEAKY